MGNERPENGNVDRYRIDQLERLAERLTERIEISNERNSQELRSLRSAINELHTLHMQTQNKVCPAPGTCLALKAQVEELVSWQKGVQKKLYAVGGVVVILVWLVNQLGPKLVSLVLP